MWYNPKLFVQGGIVWYSRVTGWGINHPQTFTYLSILEALFRSSVNIIFCRYLRIYRREIFSSATVRRMKPYHKVLSRKSWELFKINVWKKQKSLTFSDVLYWIVGRQPKFRFFKRNTCNRCRILLTKFGHWVQKLCQIFFVKLLIPSRLFC